MELFVERNGVQHFTGREVEKLRDFHHGLVRDAPFVVLQVVQDWQQRPATFGIAGNEIFLVLRFGLIAEVGLGSFHDLLGAAGFDGRTWQFLSDPVRRR